MKPESVSMRDLIMILTQACCVSCFEYQCSLMFPFALPVCSFFVVKVEAGLIYAQTKEIFVGNVWLLNGSGAKLKDYNQAFKGVAGHKFKCAHPKMW